MTEEQRKWLAFGIVTLAIVVAGFLGVRYPMPPAPEVEGVGAQAVGYSPFDSVRVQHLLNVQGATDLDSTLNVDGAADFNSTLNVDGAMTSDGDATVADDFIVAAQTAVSVTAEGCVITPTGTYQPLESAASYSGTLETSGFTTGTMLVLINSVAHTIGITDTGTAMLAGNILLGQYDSATLWFDGTNWVEVSRSDN